MCDERNNNSSGFIFGLIIGALIATAILLTSAEDKQKIIKKIKDKFKDIFDEKEKILIPKTKKIIKKTKKVIDTKIVEPIKKISVDLPKNIESLNLTSKKISKPKKVFKR